MQLAEIQLDNAERYRDLGCAIAYYRKRKGMTQEQVAELIGISRQHMGAIEAPNMVRLYHWMSFSISQPYWKSSPICF